MKSLTRIHQQTLDILSGMHRRSHTLPATLDRVIDIHNRYVSNILCLFGVSGMMQLTQVERDSPLYRHQYMDSWISTRSDSNRFGDE